MNLSKTFVICNFIEKVLLMIIEMGISCNLCSEVLQKVFLSAILTINWRVLHIYLNSGMLIFLKKLPLLVFSCKKSKLDKDGN